MDDAENEMLCNVIICAFCASISKRSISVCMMHNHLISVFHPPGIETVSKLDFQFTHI